MFPAEIKRKDLFRVTVLEIPMHDPLALLLWSSSKAACHDRHVSRAKSLTSWPVSKMSGRPGSYNPFGGHAPVTSGLFTRPHLSKFPSLPTSNTLGTRPLTCGPLEAIPGPNYSNSLYQPLLSELPLPITISMLQPQKIPLVLFSLHLPGCPPFHLHSCLPFIFPQHTLQL